MLGVSCHNNTGNEDSHNSPRVQRRERSTHRAHTLQQASNGHTETVTSMAVEAQRPIVTTHSVTGNEDSHRSPSAQRRDGSTRRAHTLQQASNGHTGMVTRMAVDAERPL